MARELQTILFIEDHLPTLELYRRELSREYRVLTCSNEHQALQMLQTQNIRAVVLEPAVGDGEGWAILAAIKNAPSGQCVPVILCSTLDERRRGLEMGAAVYVVKPALPTALLETLRRIVGAV